MNMVALAAAAAVTITAAPPPPDVAKCADDLDSAGRIVCDFNQPATTGPDPKVVQSSFLLPATGRFTDLNIDYFRNGVKVFDIATYGVKYVPEGEARVRVVISIRDAKRKTKNYQYRIAGKLYVLPEP